MGKKKRRRAGSEDPDFTLRDEANAITAYAFRIGPLEDLHSGEYSELLESDRYCRITDAEMKKLMIEFSAKVAELLRMARENPEAYQRLLRQYHRDYCAAWER